MSADGAPALLARSEASIARRRKLPFGEAWSEIPWAKLAEGAVPSPLAQSAVTHMRAQLSASAGRPGDAALTELTGNTEFTGDGSWFADY